ncbi:uncharacterized protein METZ01_LOCUS129735 [marine metagenome]|uniref:Uncharacterized protein n=1 Tax=marine metagenome TaxID=408172 RepID=A0A381YJZ7_9ZZZZ
MNIPEDMDVPASRRDTSELSNVRWLLRNLAIRNSEHPEFRTVIDWCKSAVRTKEAFREFFGMDAYGQASKLVRRYTSGK